MEGVGARLGRSSTRYGPAAVFSGPVRKWKKTWVHVSSSHPNHASHHSNTTNSHNSSHLLLYKWTPISQSSNNNNNSGIKDDDAASASAGITTEEPLRRRFRYVPVFVIEEQKKESAGDDDEDKGDTAMTDAQMTSRNSDGTDRKPDVNDMPMDETQVSNKDQEAAQGPSETSLDLNLA